MDAKSDDKMTFEELQNAMRLITPDYNPLDGPLGRCGCHIKDGIMFFCEREQASIKALNDEFKLIERDPLPGKVVKMFGLDVYAIG